MCRFALSQGVDSPQVRSALARIGREVGAAERRGAGGVLVIREWGCGFWSEVAHVLAGLLVADICGRRPCVWWGPQSLYSDGAGNAWDHYFEPLDAGGLHDALRAGPVYPEKWQAGGVLGPVIQRWEGPGSRLASVDVFARREPVVVLDFATSMVSILPWTPASHPLGHLARADVGDAVRVSVMSAYRALASTHLRVRAEHVERARTWKAQHVGNAPTLGVHIRASDKSGEYPLLAQENAKYPAMIDTALDRQPDLRVVLCTESKGVLEEYRRRYGGRIVASDSMRTSTDVGTHFLPLPDRVRLGVEALTDCLLLSMCDRFVGLATSNLSLFACHLRGWPAGECTLLGVNIQAVTSGPAHAQPAIDELRAQGLL